jgi:hypothetical protein
LACSASSQGPFTSVVVVDEPGVTLVLPAVVDDDGLTPVPPLARAMVPPIMTATNAAKIALLSIRICYLLCRTNVSRTTIERSDEGAGSRSLNGETALG